ncbi:hypothetical protein EHS25_001213 [Saitozyma podzolica]|uniref:Uncharacterized protein n=1 Tax=Saitozyma podzolica TaxID=1890683 RepID=A0A427YHN3_9TREE|nr:hypothetical protein EHS25_001213 [Saitozyma podzolica]
MNPMRRPTAARYAWAVVGLCCFSLVAVSLSPDLSRGSAVKTPLTDWFESHPLSLFSPTSRREQLRLLLSSLGPEPDVPDRSQGDGIKYTDVHPGRVCVFQADDRALQTPKAMSLDDPSFIRSHTPEEAWALHYGHSLTYWHTKLWTIRHGYRLLRLPSEEVPGRVPLWSKIPPMLRMTKDRSCDYLVWMDSDVFHLLMKRTDSSLSHVPIPGLKFTSPLPRPGAGILTHGHAPPVGMHDGHIIAVAKDATDVDGGYNTGFLILRGGDRAERLIQDWLDCPDKGAGASGLAIDGVGQTLTRAAKRWVLGLATDFRRSPAASTGKEEPWQTKASLASSWYVARSPYRSMPKLLEEDVVTEIPCMEATGNTKSYDYGTGCNGTIVTHECTMCCRYTVAVADAPGRLNGKQVLAQEIISLSAFQLLSMVEQADD